MLADHVPQDESFYAGRRRVCYAVDRTGAYVVVTSKGWEVERAATALALEELARELAQARAAVLAGRLSPLAYHMSARRMSPALLAQGAGAWTWLVRLHLMPWAFRRLPRRTLQRYAAVLDVPVGSHRGTRRTPTGAGSHDDRL